MRAQILLLSGLLGLGCGAPSMSSFFPADGSGSGGTAPAVGSYVKDPDGRGFQSVTGGTVQERSDAMQLAVDGAAADYASAGAMTLATEKYSKAAYRLEIKVWEFASASSAASGYDTLTTSANLFKATTWQTASIGAKGRIADTLTDWWVNSQKGAYIVDVSVHLMNASGDAESDDTSKADAQAFAQAVVGKIP